MKSGEELRRKVWAPFGTIWDELGSDYILRYCRAPQPKPILLVTGGKYYIADNPSDLWGEKRFISHSELRDLIDRLTCQAWPFPPAQSGAKEKQAVRGRIGSTKPANRRETPNRGYL